MDYPTYSTRSGLSALPQTRICPDCRTTARIKWKKEDKGLERTLDPSGSVWWPCHTPNCPGEEGIINS
ncbi:hypothetical protein ABZ714_19550 [Streptomyces sp. NPDC006798]|uniref:hypothetical protein n=1 Tax=Streptomyces sp. NPDC006798 TaxID=3155462 RepID=UPI0033CC8C4D